MKTIQIKSSVESVIAFENGWLINDNTEGYYLIDLECNVFHYYGSVLKGYFGEEEHIILLGNGLRVGYIDKHGKKTQVPEKCVVSNNPKYRYQFIEKDSIFDPIFEIPEDKIGLAINKSGANYVIISLPNVFKDFHGFDRTRLSLSISSNEETMLIYQSYNDQILVINNPLK